MAKFPPAIATSPVERSELSGNSNSNIGNSGTSDAGEEVPDISGVELGTVCGVGATPAGGAAGVMVRVRALVGNRVLTRVGVLVVGDGVLTRVRIVVGGGVLI